MHTLTPAIELESFTFRYANTQADTLDIKHLKIERGERVFLKGDSGIGKSTLLHVLCGLRVGTGNLSILGKKLAEYKSANRDKFRAHHIGMVFQQFNLIAYLSAFDNVLLAARLMGKQANAAHRATYLLEQVGLEARTWNQTAQSLSIGQQQRVAIARALINAPDLLLFDEPTSALDKKNQNLFMSMLTDYLHEHPHTTAVFVSHDERLASYFKKSIDLSDILASRSLTE